MLISHFFQLRRRLWVAVMVGALSFSPSNSYAATATASIVVSATVLSICIAAATPLAFGNYDSSAGTATTTTASVIVTCTNGTPYSVALGAGNGTGATVAQRVMTNGSNTLNYNLYTTSGYSSIWGNGTLSTVTQSGTAGLTPTTYTVYGKIPANQYVTSGVYGDSVTATVTY
jgi:spore coat protein U-like protein